MDKLLYLCAAKAKKIAKNMLKAKYLSLLLAAVLLGQTPALAKEKKEKAKTEQKAKSKGKEKKGKSFLGIGKKKKTERRPSSGMRTC